MVLNQESLQPSQNIIKSENKSEKKSNFIKSFSQVQNSYKRLPISHSLKSISKAKNVSASNSFSMTGTESLKNIKESSKNNKIPQRISDSGSKPILRPSLSEVSNRCLVVPSESESSPSKFIVNITNKTQSKSKSKLLNTPIKSNEKLSSSSQKSLLTLATNTNKSSTSLANASNSSPAQTPTHLSSLDQNEKYLLKHYARYSKTAAKSSSAVVRVPSVQTDTINRQSSLSTAVVNKMSSQLVKSSFLGNSFFFKNSSFNKKMDKSNSCKQESIDEEVALNFSPTQTKPPSENVSAVSSKISLFKKVILDIYRQDLKNNCRIFAS